MGSAIIRTPRRELKSIFLHLEEVIYDLTNLHLRNSRFFAVRLYFFLEYGVSISWSLSEAEQITGRLGLLALPFLI